MLYHDDYAIYGYALSTLINFTDNNCEDAADNLISYE